MERSLGLLYNSLKVVIANNPTLNLVIHGESTDSPYFGFPKSIDLKNHVTWLPELAKKGEEEETKMIEKQIGTQFNDIDTIPPWKVTIIPRGDSLSVTFFFHHSLGDGTSGKVFLLSLLKALNQNPSSEIPKVDLDKFEIDSVVMVPEVLSIPPSVEQVLDMPVGFWKLAKIFGQEWGLLSTPTVWSGGPVIDCVSGESIPPTNISKLSINSQDMSKLQMESKTRKTTITALVTAIAVASVAKALPDNVPFSEIGYSIPRNLRPIITSVDLASRMGVYVAGINGNISRTNITSTKFDSEQVWQVCSDIKKTIQESLSEGNRNLDTGLLQYVSNLRHFFIKKMGKSRGRSVEMSSLVISDVEIAMSGGPGGWKMDDLYFYQCANTFGSPLCFSSFGYKGAALNISCVWGTGVVEDELVEKVLNNFKTYVRILVDNIND